MHIYTYTLARTHTHTIFKIVYQKRTKFTNIVYNNNVEGNLSVRERLLLISETVFYEKKKKEDIVQN